MHQLSHIPFIIKENGPLVVNSLRVMERSIGYIKRQINARINVGENVNNILQRQGLLTYIKSLNLMSFEGPNQPESAHKASTFYYHPDKNDENREYIGQLWAPFPKDFYMNNENQPIIEGLSAKMKDFVNAMKSCKKRMFSLTNTPLSRIDLDYEQIVRPSGKAWQQDVVYTSCYAKLRFSRSLNKRGGEHVIFNSYHIEKMLVKM